MSFKAGRFLTATLVVSLFIQMQISVNGYASRRGKIAFASTRDGNSEIYVMDGDRRNQRRVTVNPAVDRLPAWSPDGKKIAFVSNRNNRNKDHKQIWAIDSDGKRILYDAHLDPEEHNLAPAGITVMDADGNNKRLLTDEGAHPSWSPDGERIAFMSGRNGKVNHIYVMDADGQNQMQLTHDFVHKRLPSWSPDGKRIAYVGDNVIWVVDSDGENQKQLTKIITEEHPTWSPDSESIAFHSFGRDRGLGGRDLVIGIYMVDVTNGAVNAIQRDPEFWNLEPDWLYPGELSVSPQGSRITMWGRLKKIASN